MHDVDPTNQGQAEFWDGPGSTHWVAGADRYDAQLEPFNELIIDGAALETGRRVADIGCGTGALSRAAAEVAGDGGVTGYDISEAMIAAAVERSGGRTHHAVADAQVHPFEPAAVDAVISRFGVMFFGDPTAAFTNLLGATRPGGRLSVACWQSATDNEWMRTPEHAISEVLGPLPPVDPEAPGPFAFARADRVEGILRDAGWSDRNIDAVTLDLYMGGPGGVDDAVEFMMGRTAVASLLTDRSAAEAEAVRSLLREAFEPRHDGIGVRFSSAAWLVRARRR